MLTFHALRKLYEINFSPAGSNNRRHEEEVIYCFEAFSADCEGKIIIYVLHVYEKAVIYELKSY